MTKPTKIYCKKCEVRLNPDEKHPKGLCPYCMEEKEFDKLFQEGNK